MTYDERKSLYEMVMKDLSKELIKMLNEKYTNEDAQWWYSLYDPNNNKMFTEKYDKLFRLTSDGKIATKIVIENIKQDFDKAAIFVSADSLGLLMQKVEILLYASIDNMFMNNSFDFDCCQELKDFLKKWRITFMNFHNHKSYNEIPEIDHIIGDLSAKMFYDNKDKNAQQVAIKIYKILQQYESLKNLKVYPK